MSYTAENGNFEGRPRAAGAFGNESGRAGKAAAGAAERTPMAKAPTGPFKSPVYDATPQNLARLAGMVGPMVASPGIGLAAPLAKAILSGDAYGAFGMPRGWSSYSPRDIDPTGTNPRGNIGGRDGRSARDRMAQAQRQAALLAALRAKQAMQPRRPVAPPMPTTAYVPRTIGDQAPGLPLYSTATQGYGKSGGYGGAPRAMAAGDIPGII